MIFNNIACEPSSESDLLERFKTLSDIIDYIAEHESKCKSLVSVSVTDSVCGIYSQIERSLLQLHKTGVYRCRFLGAVLSPPPDGVNRIVSGIDMYLTSRTVSMQLYDVDIDPYTFIVKECRRVSDIPW